MNFLHRFQVEHLTPFAFYKVVRAMDVSSVPPRSTRAMIPHLDTVRLVRYRSRPGATSDDAMRSIGLLLSGGLQATGN